jgi:ech hydrogenase subunit D
MNNEKPQVFIDITADELMNKVEDYDTRGWRFVNICGSTVEGGVELIYSFSDGLPLENLRFTVSNGSTIPSVSGRFPNAFFFENETYDLFGVKFSGVSIDFDGKFYKVSVPTPMNPQSAQARAAAAESTTGASEAAAQTANDTDNNEKGDN